MPDLSALGDDQDVERLAAAAAAGDGDALAQLYERYVDHTYRVAYRHTRNELHAQDVMAETWERVARSVVSYRQSGAGFPAWLHRIETNILRDWHRQLRRRREWLTGDMLLIDQRAPDDAPEQVALRHELAAQVAQVVNGLDKRQRQVLIYRFYDNLSAVETAALMGMTPGNVRQIQYRALRELGRRLPPELAWTSETPTMASLVVGETRSAAEAGGTGTGTGTICA